MMISNQRPQGHPIHSALSILSTLSAKEAQKPKSIATAPAGASGHHPRYLRLPEVRQIVPLSSASIWRKTRNGTFPPAIKISERVTVWSAQAISSWLAEKEAA